MPGPGLSTSRTTGNTPAEHVADHNAAHAIVNMFDTAAPSQFAVRSAGKIEWASGGGSFDTSLERVVQDNGSIALSTTNNFVVGSVRFKVDANALIIAEVAGTNGRRLSIQPHNAGTSTASSQLELVPGTSVAPTAVTSQILFYHKTGADYERFVISCYNNEYQFHASRAGTGVARPTFFYVDNVASTGWMADATFKVYKQVDFCDPADPASSSPVWGTIKGYAINSIGTAHTFRIREGAVSQLRIGDPIANGRPTITFGTDATVYLTRLASPGAQLDLNGAGGLKINGPFGANSVTPAAKQTVDAAATDAATTQALVNQIRAALITFGLAV